MFPAPFDYRRATSVDDALELLTAEPDRDVRALAGGHGLLPAMKTEGLAPDVLVDVGECDALRGIEVATDGDGNGGRETGDGSDAAIDEPRVDHLSIGPLTTHAELAASERVATHAPPLVEAARAVGDAQIRNRGTIGGNLVEADPEADLPAAMAATDASLRLRSPDGDREVATRDFFAGAGETVVRDDELVTEIRVPAADAGAYVRRTHPARGFATVGVAVAMTVADGVLSNVGVGAVGVTDRPVRLSTVEAALRGRRIEELGSQPDGKAGTIEPGTAEPVARAAAAAADAIDDERLHGDVHASGQFRASVLDTYVERALGDAGAGLVGGESGG